MLLRDRRQRVAHGFTIPAIKLALNPGEAVPCANATIAGEAWPCAGFNASRPMT
jgi:hypothetical protein